MSKRPGVRLAIELNSTVPAASPMLPAAVRLNRDDAHPIAGATTTGGKLAPIEKRLANCLFQGFPRPTGPTEEAAWSWFRLLDLLSEQAASGGQTARWIARQENLPAHRIGRLDELLGRLADAGDLIRTGRNPTRFRAQAWFKCLPKYIASAELRSGAEWEAFDLAILAYIDTPKALQWSNLKASLVALVNSLPGWPEHAKHEIQEDIERWAGPCANVEPPSYVAVDDEWARLKLEVERLRANNEQLEARLTERDHAGEEQRARLKQRVEALQHENTTLKREVSDLQEQLEGLEEDLGGIEKPSDGPELHAFLEGRGRGALPLYVPDDEVERLRKLVMSTRAPRERQLALAARLGDIYACPHRYQRLTSMSFQQATHSFETVHRVAVYKYRIGYGLSKKTPFIIDIGPRENVYGRFISKLNHMDHPET